MNPNQPTILVVDDEDEVREMMRRILRFSAFNVLEAREADEGLALALKHKPDLITLDIMMPGRDGIRLCGELKSNELTKDIPVVVVTVAGSRTKAMEAGADYYMNKLFSIDEFVRVVRGLIKPRPAAPQAESPV
ncbi:MAG: response regulator [Bacteroidetes bacterium]|nr:response regulator [Bacteroidota bacterium]